MPEEKFKVFASGNCFPRMQDGEGNPCMFHGEVFLHATDENGVTTTVGYAELKFDRAELFPYLLKKSAQTLAPFLEQVMKTGKIERPSLELVEKFRRNGL